MGGTAHHFANMRFTFLQIIFGTDFGESKSVPVSLPKGCSDPFAYIVTKVAEGSYKATTSIYAPWIHVRNRTFTNSLLLVNTISIVHIILSIYSGLCNHIVHFLVL